MAGAIAYPRGVRAPWRLCFPDGYLGSDRRHRAVCHCGWTTTPRVSRERADEALMTEHGFTDPDDGCGICGRTTGDYRIGDVVAGQTVTSQPAQPWDVYEVLVDPDRGGREVYICRDRDACNARHRAVREADRLSCGCERVWVAAVGHYHDVDARPLLSVVAPITGS